MGDLFIEPKWVINVINIYLEHFCDDFEIHQDKYKIPDAFYIDTTLKSMDEIVEIALDFIKELKNRQLKFLD